VTREVEGAVERTVEGGAFLAYWQDLPFVFPVAVARGAADEADWLRQVEDVASLRESGARRERDANRQEAMRGWRDGRRGRPKGAW